MGSLSNSLFFEVSIVLYLSASFTCALVFLWSPLIAIFLITFSSLMVPLFHSFVSVSDFLRFLSFILVTIFT